ncbi:hypothetical protein Cgig2_017973 [Carnegiea gigantea]|uniref:Uncharacterized protein n=1 Tax=Carnegiea gigantea TaxID=171969 RepID=A0A9Q1JLJ1_9CARY|nr:hypothetical protein Cgig2_017973 [Carnegiea gigantea]
MRELLLSNNMAREDLGENAANRVDKIPSRLARWLVEKFDTCRQAVKLASNDELRISEEDACVQKISRLLKNFACSVIEVVNALSEAQQMFPASTKMDKVQGVLVEILTNYLKLGTFKDTAGPSQTQSGDANVGYFTPPGFDLGFDFRLSQSVQVENPNQGGGGGVEGIGFGSQSSPDPHIERSSHLSLESSVGDTVGDCLPPRKKMPSPHFRSPELLFAYANFNITRFVIRTLACVEEFHPALVDLFAYLVNHSEKLKDRQSLSSSISLCTLL